MLGQHGTFLTTKPVDDLSKSFHSKDLEETLGDTTIFVRFTVVRQIACLIQSPQKR